MYDLVLHGNLVTSEPGVTSGWVAVDQERIVAVGTGAAPDGRRKYEAGDGWIFPGFVDGQTHACSQQGYAGLGPTTRSAIVGGITTIVDMPYDNPNPLNNIESLNHKLEAINRDCYGDVALYATVAPGQGVGHIEDLRRAGVCALKLSSYESHPVRFPRVPADEILQVLEASVGTDLPVGLHNEDQEIVRAGLTSAAAQGRTSPRWHSDSRPIAAELAATAAFLELGAVTGAHAHLVHLSTLRGYQLVARYRGEGAKTTAEICAHYLHFDGEADVNRLGGRLKVNPPLRPGALPGLWNAFSAGSAAFVSSDHSSWPLANKQTISVLEASAGIPGLETLVPSFYSDLSRRGHDALHLLREYLAERPAKFFGFWPRKGCMAVGSDADFAVLQPKPYAYQASKSHDGLHWSPYDGEIFEVRVKATFVRGQMVWDGENIVCVPGHGRFVPRNGRSIFA